MSPLKEPYDTSKSPQHSKTHAHERKEKCWKLKRDLLTGAQKEGLRYARQCKALLDKEPSHTHTHTAGKRGRDMQGAAGQGALLAHGERHVE
jgi:hypothetical protein